MAMVLGIGHLYWGYGAGTCGLVLELLLILVSPVPYPHLGAGTSTRVLGCRSCPRTILKKHSGLDVFLLMLQILVAP